MSDIQAVGGDASVQADTFASEELTEAQVKGLIEGGKTAIKQKDFDRAHQIITQLSHIHHKAQASKGWIDTLCHIFSGPQCAVSDSDLSELFRELCLANHEEGKKLISVLSKNISIHSDGHRYKISGSGFRSSFSIPIQTDPEAEVLIKHLYKLKNERNFGELEKELPRLAQFCIDQKVAWKDFTTLYINLVFANVSFAVKCFPIFKHVYHMKVHGQYLFSEDPKSGLSSRFNSSVFLLLDYNTALKRISGEEKPEKRFSDYLYLATHQLERAPEAVKKAEEELDHIEGAWERLSAKLTLVLYFQRNHDEVNFNRVATDLERELNQTSDDVEKRSFFLARVNIFRALIYLEKKDRSGFDWCISGIKHEMAHVKEEKQRKMLENDLKHLESRREETFSMDQLELHTRKV